MSLFYKTVIILVLLIILLYFISNITEGYIWSLPEGYTSSYIWTDAPAGKNGDIFMPGDESKMYLINNKFNKPLNPDPSRILGDKPEIFQNFNDQYVIGPRYGKITPNEYADTYLNFVDQSRFGPSI